MNQYSLIENVLDPIMKQAVLRKVLHVDADRDLQINIPIEMGNEFEVIVLPIQPDFANRFSELEQFNIGVHSVSTKDSDEENAIWEKYVKA